MTSDQEELHPRSHRKMPFFSNLKKVLNLGGDAKKKKPNLEHIAVDVDPEEVRFIRQIAEKFL